MLGGGASVGAGASVRGRELVLGPGASVGGWGGGEGSARVRRRTRAILCYRIQGLARFSWPTVVLGP